MEIVHTILEVREKIKAAKKLGKTVGFVPTMGFLHEGHLSLVESSKEKTDYQVMSIFVNRIQFNNPGDFSNYPKDLIRDFELAEKAGVDLMFAPDEDEMYDDNLTHVDVDVLTANLCGAHREGHFQGVFTVVSKLFNIVLPDVAVFGQKDIQQVVSIKKMVEDLNFPVEIVVAPIVRESDGLALSSRNKHLSKDERERALVIYKSLKVAEDLLNSGELNSEIIKKAIEQELLKGSPDSIDYISVVSYFDLSYVENIEEQSVIAIAANFGETRLIDNMIVEVDIEDGEI